MIAQRTSPSTKDHLPSPRDSGWGHAPAEVTELVCSRSCARQLVEASRARTASAEVYGNRDLSG